MSEPCLLLFARRGDAVVETLQRAAPQRVAHACIADLSHEGWRYEGGRPECASAFADGRVFSADRIAAVLCRVASVTPMDLPHVHRDDRAYVAAEINAFMHAWLAQFSGVRFNAPTWASLAGPGWHALQWRSMVAGLGVPLACVNRTRDTVTATVVGGDVFGVDEPVLVEHSLRIARAARSELLGVTFVRDHEWSFLAADPCPALDSASASAIVRRAFAPMSKSLARALCDAA